MPHYDVCVIGAGPGGYVAAIRASQLGQKTCVIEQAEVGGTCLNRGCIPTKALWHSAKLLANMQRAGEFGIDSKTAKINFKTAQERAAKVISTLGKGVQGLLKKNKVELINGTATLKGEREVQVASGKNKLDITASHIIVATGSEPAKPDAFPFDGKAVITSDEMLRAKKLPESAIIVGAGYIGCEFASILNAFGVKVTLVEALERILPNLDADLASELARAFKKRKIAVHAGTKIEELKVGKKGVTAKISGGKSLSAEIALICVGRKPRVEEVGLAEVGVEMENGAIKRDEECRTTVPSIYAIGDVASPIQLAHWASAEGKVAAESAAGEFSRSDTKAVPSCIFTIPEIASVGMTEDEAKEKGFKVRSVKFPFRNLGKSLVAGELDGFFKLVAEEETGELLGAQIIGDNASDIIAELALAIRLECTVEELARTVHAHPTFAEGIMEAAEMWLGKAIHA